MRGLARLISSAISKLGEDGTRQEAERALAHVAFLEHFRADDVGGHQVGRELDALPVEAEHDAQRLDQPRLGETRHADEQTMAAGEQRDQHLVDHIVLAEDDAADPFAHFGEEGGRGFGMRHGGAVLGRFGNRVGVAHRSSCRRAEMSRET